MPLISRTYPILFFLFIVLVTGCAAEKIEIDLDADPSKSVSVGETIVVVADGNHNVNGVTWFTDGRRVYSCNRKNTCPFSSNKATTVKITIKVDGDVQEDRGVFFNLVSLATGAGSDSAEDGKASINISWTQETDNTDTSSEE